LRRANLPQLVQAAEVQLDFLAEDDQARVMGLNALAVYSS
jgi:hypothetical protein